MVDLKDREGVALLDLINLRTGFCTILGICLLLLAHYTHAYNVLISTLFKEIGFAFIVAVIIWGMFEYSQHSESEDKWNKRIESMTKNVFMGVFKRNLPDALIREANTLVLNQNFLREDFHVIYTLRDDIYNDEAGIAQP